MCLLWGAALLPLRCYTCSWQKMSIVPCPDTCLQVYAAPILFERNAYDVPVFTRVHDFMWSGEALSRFQYMFVAEHATVEQLHPCERM